MQYARKEEALEGRPQISCASVMSTAQTQGHFSTWETTQLPTSVTHSDASVLSTDSWIVNSSMAGAGFYI